MKKIENIIKKLEDDLYMNAPFGYLSITTNGIIKKANTLILNWTEYSPEEIQDKNVDHLFPGLKLNSEHDNTLSFDGMYNMRRKDNSIVSVSVDVVKLRERKNKDIVLSITLNSDQNNLNKKLKEPSKEFHTPINKFATPHIAYTSSTAAHEIQTPLGIIKGTLDLLDDTALTNQQKEYLDILKQTSEVLRNVLFDVIDFNSLNNNSHLKQDEINLRTFITSIFKMHCVNALKKNLNLKLVIDERMPEVVQGDKTKIAQVLLNLLSNAVKFTEKGSVTLEIQQQDISEDTVTILFKVTDTGIGIQEDEITIIFNEFTQANSRIKEEFGGLGLGLSICKKVLALYGSEIKVKSSKNGSEFSFSLTLSLKKPLENYNLQVSKNKPESEVTILIADDNETNAIITSHYLRKLGIQYEIAQNGEIAYNKVLEGKFHLVLMDLLMPVSDGVLATKKIRSIEDSQIRNIPIVAFSADNFLTKTQLNEIGINDFLLKPFTIEELQNVITLHIEKSKLNSNPEKETPGSISLEALYTLTAGRNDELKILIRKAIDEFEAGKNDFVAAFERNDVVKVKAIAHKLKPQIHYLRANKLKQVIEKGREIIENNGTLENAPSDVLTNIVNALDESIHLLKIALNK